MHFQTSNYEISYCDIRLQPLIFQDDISRLSSSPRNAQAGNIFVEACMEAKLLDLNTHKLCFIILGNDKTVQPIKDELLSNPLTLCGNIMKEKVSDKYLGDYIHGKGTSASVQCTISNRYGRTVLAIPETRAIIDDCRVNTIGGLQSGLDYWEMAYLPSLLNNCQTWPNISETSLTMLEDLQNMMYWILLIVPQTCPKPALCWEMGGIQIKFRIIMKKLNFLWHLFNLDEGSLAKEVFNAQKQFKLPGLVEECSDWIKILKLPDLYTGNLSKTQWKTQVRKAILRHNEDDLRAKMKTSSKLRSSKMIKEKCDVKPYVKNMSVNNARHIFKKRTSMTQYVKMNFMGEIKYMKDLWRCDSCQTKIDNMNHVLCFPSYIELRAGKDMDNDSDMASYLHDVMLIRSKLDIHAPRL